MPPDDRVERDSPDWQRVALAALGAAVILTDTRGRVVLLNAAAETMTGWTQSEADGRPLADVLRIEDEHTRAPITDPASEALATGAAVGVPGRAVLVARGGAGRAVDGGAAPVRDAAGVVAGAVLALREVTDRRRLERSHERSLAYAQEIIATLREPFLVLDRDLRVRTANAAFYRTFRVSPGETEGRLLHHLGDGAWDIPWLRALLADVVPGDRPVHDYEVEHTFPAIGRRAMLLNARRFPPGGEAADSVLLAFEDVTDRRAAARALADSETRYRRLFEAAQDGILIVDPVTRRIADVNPFLTDMLGYTRDELVGRELWEIGLFGDAEANRAAFRKLQEVGYIRYEDLPLRTRDGRPIDVEFVSNVYPVDHTPVIQCNIRDVTDRKRAEAGLREAHARLEERVAERTAELAAANTALTAASAARRELLRRLETAQEDERRRIARELHDQLGQYLAALGLGLENLLHAAPDGFPAGPQIRQLQRLTEAVGRELHAVAVELRPTALDDLGLAAALATYLDGWAARSGVAADFHAAGPDVGRLPPAVETALYRVAQEALTNVLKHARAARVSVTLHRTPGEVAVVVEDDGAGFDPDAGVGTGQYRLGLVGMRERAELVGGTMVVESSPGGGTTVIARVPLTGGGEAGRG